MKIVGITITTCSLVLLLLSQLAAATASSSSSEEEVQVKAGGVQATTPQGIGEQRKQGRGRPSEIIARLLMGKKGREDDEEEDAEEDEEDSSNVSEIEISADQQLGGSDILRNLKRKSQQGGAKKKKSSQRKTRRVVVNYGNNQGLIDAMALGGRVYHHFATHKAVVLELDDESTAYLDGWDENIMSIEDDPIWEEMGYLEEHLDDSNVRRKLAGEGAESVPYGIKMVQADKFEMGSKPVTVCVTDTGATRRHPDLKKAKIKGSSRYDDIDGEQVFQKWKKDVRGHGTHVAGTISAVSHNGIGVQGIGEIPLFITRALNDLGKASESDIREAVEQCVESGAKIISMSLGGGGMTTTFKEYLTSLYKDNGILIFAAAGNNNQNMEKWPGALAEVVSVSAVDAEEQRWSGSNWADCVEMAAPGNMVLSTSIKNGRDFAYSYYSGTSMAVPHASGVAAKVWSHHPDCTNDQIRYAMAITAKDLQDGTAAGGRGCDQKFGYGLIQAKDALDFLDANPCSKNRDWADTAKLGGCKTVPAEKLEESKRVL